MMKFGVLNLETTAYKPNLHSHSSNTDASYFKPYCQTRNLKIQLFPFCFSDKAHPATIEQCSGCNRPEFFDLGRVLKKKKSPLL